MNNWGKLGYIEPMVVIMPEIEALADNQGSVEDARIFISDGHFKTLLDNAKFGGMDFSYKIDNSRDISVAGYSLGASEALYAGQKYPKDIVNIGACSPSMHCYYGEGKGQWINHEKEVRFSTSPRAHFFFEYGQAEKNDFGMNAKRYNDAFENNKVNDLTYKANSFVFYTSYYEGHVWNTMKREIFSFLFYLNRDTLPSDSVVEEACVISNNGEKKNMYRIKE